MNWKWCEGVGRDLVRGALPDYFLERLKKPPPQKLRVACVRLWTQGCFSLEFEGDGRGPLGALSRLFLEELRKTIIKGTRWRDRDTTSSLRMPQLHHRQRVNLVPNISMQFIPLCCDKWTAICILPPDTAVLLFVFNNACYMLRSVRPSWGMNVRNLETRSYVANISQFARYRKFYICRNSEVLRISSCVSLCF